MKELKKACSCNSAMWRGWRKIGLPIKCVGSLSVSGPRERWIDNVKECLRKRGLDIRQAKKMVQDRCKWRGFIKRNAWGVAWRMNSWP